MLLVLVGRVDVATSTSPVCIGPLAVPATRKRMREALDDLDENAEQLTIETRQAVVEFASQVVSGDYGVRHPDKAQKLKNWVLETGNTLSSREQKTTLAESVGLSFQQVDDFFKNLRRHK